MAERKTSRTADPMDELEMYRKLLVIDKYALDDALEVGSSLFSKVGDAHAVALSRAETAKANIDELEARIDADIRRDADRAGEKITESAIKQEIKLDKEMVAAVSDYLEKREVANRWNALREAFAQRSRDVGKLGDLYIAQYFTRSSIRRAERTSADEADRAANEARKADTAARRENGSSRRSER